MAGLNKVMLIGNLGDDPEIRSLNNGDDVANFSVATSEQWKDRDGNKQERTEWHRVVCFNQHLIKVIENYLKKGSKVYVMGQLQTRKWTDQSGADRYSTEVVLQRFGSEVILLGDAGGGRSDDRGDGYDRGGRGSGGGSGGGGRGGGRDDRGSGGNRGTRNNRGGGKQGDFGGDDFGEGGRTDGFDGGGYGGTRPHQAFDSDLDDDVPF